MICFAMVCLPVLLAVDDCEHFVLTQDEVLLAVDLDVLTRVLAEQDRVAGLDVGVLAAAIIPDFALPDSEHLDSLRLLLGGIGHDDAADGLFAFLAAVNYEPVVRRSDVHVSSRSGRGMRRRAPGWPGETGWNDETSRSVHRIRGASCSEQDIS